MYSVKLLPLVHFCLTRAQGCRIHTSGFTSVDSAKTSKKVWMICKHVAALFQCTGAIPAANVKVNQTIMKQQTIQRQKNLV